MDRPINTITDQQVSRRSKVPLKILRMHPDYLEGFRKYMTLTAEADAHMKESRQLLKEAKLTCDRETIQKSQDLGKLGIDALDEARSILWNLKRPIDGAV